MISKFVKPGDRVEIQSLFQMRMEDSEDGKKVYKSEVYDIVSEDQIELTMPIEKTKLILLPIDREYEFIFYTNTGLFQCFGRILERYKNNNIYLLSVELTSNLRKHQRREFYRFNCALELCSRVLSEEEKGALEEKRPYVLNDSLPLARSVIVDISGGGLRFMSVKRYEPETLLYCSYHLMIQGERKKYELIGRILNVNELANRPGTYEHRVKYVDMDVDTREEIIKYIFEEERKNRKRESER